MGGGLRGSQIPSEGPPSSSEGLRGPQRASGGLSTPQEALQKMDRQIDRTSSRLGALPRFNVQGSLNMYSRVKGTADHYVFFSR